MSEPFQAREPRAGGGLAIVIHYCPFDGCSLGCECRDALPTHTRDSCAYYRPWLAQHLTEKHPGWTTDDLEDLALCRPMT